MEPERRAGHWWRPEAPDRRIAGSLDTSGDGPIRLELLDLLTDGYGHNRYDVVLGTTADGLPVTLESLQQIGRSGHSSRRLETPVDTEVLMPRVAYLGAHLATTESRTFKRAVVDLTDLIVWAGDSGIAEEFGPEPVELSISVSNPPPLRADVGFGSLSLRHGWSTTGDAVRSRGIEKSVGFVVELDGALAMEDWLARVVNPLRHFLTFATDRPNEVTQLTFKTLIYDEVHGSDVHTEYRKVSVHDSIAPANDFEFLFDARTLGSAFAATLKTWFAIYARQGPILDLYLGPSYRPGTFAENHFLNAVAAAEGYHRATFPNALVPAAQHRARLKVIADAASPEDRAWLQERLAFSNEPTLRNRLVDLHERTMQIVSGVLGSAEDFAGPIVRARNALTHRGNGTPKPTEPVPELWRLTEQTNFLITACLLLDLGFDEMSAVNATRRSRRFRMLTEVRY